MINAWRDAWKGIGDFPFIYAQLAPYTGNAKIPGFGDISIIRLAQADAQPHIGLDTTGMAVTIDLGDPSAPLGDVHSREKEQVAYRMALQAMHVSYAFQSGEAVLNHEHPDDTPNPFNLSFSGPILNSISRAMHHSDADMMLSFAYGEGLYLNDTLGCKIHRGQDVHGNTIGGKDFFSIF